MPARVESASTGRAVLPKWFLSVKRPSIVKLCHIWVFEGVQNPGGDKEGYVGSTKEKKKEIVRGGKSFWGL